MTGSIANTRKENVIRCTIATAKITTLMVCHALQCLCWLIFVILDWAWGLNNSLLWDCLLNALTNRSLQRFFLMFYTVLHCLWEDLNRKGGRPHSDLPAFSCDLTVNLLWPHCDLGAFVGQCDPGCNNEACEFDGLDCDGSSERLADGEIVVIVLVEPETFLNNSVIFLRKLARLLRAKVDIKMDADGLPMVSHTFARFFTSSIPSRIFQPFGAGFPSFWTFIFHSAGLLLASKCSYWISTFCLQVYPWMSAEGDETLVTRVRRYIEGRVRRAAQVQRGTKVHLIVDNRSVPKLWKSNQLLHRKSSAPWLRIMFNKVS